MVRAQLKSWSKALHRETYLRNVALANQSRHCSVSPLQLVHRLRCIKYGRLVAVLEGRSGPSDRQFGERLS